MWFNVLSNCKVVRANDHRDVAILGHMGMLCGTCQAPCNDVVYHIQKLWVLCFQRTFFPFISHRKPMAGNCALGQSLYGLQGHG